MGWLYRFFFGTWLDKDGSRLPCTRAGIGAIVVLAFSLMLVLAYAEELRLGRPLWIRFWVAVGVAALMLLLVEKKRLALGCALCIIAFRLTFGAVFVAHTVLMIVGTLLCWLLAWMLLRDVR